MLRMQDQLDIVKTQGYYDASGKWVQSGQPPFTIWCNIQPKIKRADRENLPEGKNARQAWTVYCPFETEISVADELTGQAGDETVIDGFTCEAVYSEKWRHLNLAHYKVLFVRKDVEQNV